MSVNDLCSKPGITLQRDCIVGPWMGGSTMCDTCLGPYEMDMYLVNFKIMVILYVSINVSSVP